MNSTEYHKQSFALKIKAASTPILTGKINDFHKVKIF